MNKNRTENPNIASERIDVLEKGEIFVFGSNLAGHHMGGAPRAVTILSKVSSESSSIETP